MSAVALDVAAVRARFSALQRPTAFFDGPGGTQMPDSVIEAMAAYLRESNANLGAPFGTSRRSDALVVEAHEAAARFLGCSPDEVGFGQNMTTLNFALSRTVGRELRAGDEIVVTRLDHDGNIAPWLELAADLDLVVRFADLREEDATLDLDDLERRLGDRTRIVAFPWASNAVGSLTDVRRIADLAHEAGALAWVDAVHYAPHGPIDVEAAGIDVLLCSAYKFFGPHLGLFFGRRELIERWRPYRVRPAPTDPPAARFETGTLPHEALAGFSAAVEYVESVGREAMTAHERELGARFLAGLPESVRLHGPPTMDARVATFALTVPRFSPEEAATRLAERDIAVYWGDYYAVEVMRRLGLPDGAVRVGIIHYNTAEEVDRLLSELEGLA
ncbi:MAG TPA: cysteine desulfurase-like protein [Gaiellaceae bacterium]|nr:cysteine desulfurase-like protein [Gaiellaceae bacterium]